MGGKYTPGPWKLEELDSQQYQNSQRYQILCGEQAIQGNHYCCQVFDFDLEILDGEELEEAKANLTVMAAGAELLEALEETYKVLGSLKTTYEQAMAIVIASQKARAAIAKARGIAR